MHRSMIDQRINPTCCLCDFAPDESSHIIKDCTAIVGLRLQYFQKWYLEDEWEPSLILDLLKKDPQISILEEDSSDEE